MPILLINNNLISITRKIIKIKVTLWYKMKYRVKYLYIIFRIDLLSILFIKKYIYKYFPRMYRTIHFYSLYIFLFLIYICTCVFLKKSSIKSTYKIKYKFHSVIGCFKRTIIRFQILISRGLKNSWITLSSSK